MNMSWLINMTALPHLGIKNFQEPVCSLYILSMVTTPLSIFSTKKAEVRQCIISHLAYLPSNKCDGDH